MRLRRQRTQTEQQTAAIERLLVNMTTMTARQWMELQRCPHFRAYLEGLLVENDVPLFGTGVAETKKLEAV